MKYVSLFRSTITDPLIRDCYFQFARSVILEPIQKPKNMEREKPFLTFKL